MIVPGTPRDSLHILEALLNLDGGVKPEMVATDNASYSVRRDRQLRRGGGPGPQPGQPEQGDRAVAGHAEGRRFPGHQPGPRLRPAAHVRPRRAPDPAGIGVRRVRADRKDRAPAACGRPRRRHLPPPDEPPTHRAGIPPQAGPRRVPRQARHHPPGLPRRHGGPPWRARPGSQRHRAVDRAVP
ncbi:hypothetical protein SCOCK_140147 [Actinacidiphila cocklensis]|uniref:Uncharacterized protein n=1 Tax=Actinacidiphila cocklensis TaxID=887465 RepID=A0A9W4GPU6_9ACTN|nr:hypothetical protein SCOCK_140147 [Actinacidiphila cocklensis]